jgi:hypothetical protein
MMASLLCTPSGYYKGFWSLECWLLNNNIWIHYFLSFIFRGAPLLVNLHVSMKIRIVI